jgi:hypothetical protein
MQADMEEKREFFVEAGKIEDDEGLMDELDELEAAMAEDEMNAVDIGSGAVEYGKSDPIKQQSKPAAQQSEEDELKALEALMA